MCNNIHYISFYEPLSLIRKRHARDVLIQVLSREMQVRIKRGKKQLSSTMTRFNWQCLKDRLNKVEHEETFPPRTISHSTIWSFWAWPNFHISFTSLSFFTYLCSKLLKSSQCTYIFWEFELAKVLSLKFLREISALARK